MHFSSSLSLARLSMAVLVILLSAGTALADAIEAAPDEYIVKYNQEALDELARFEPLLALLSDREAVEELNDILGLFEKEDLPIPLAALVKLHAGTDSLGVNQAIEMGLIEYIEPNYKLELVATPDDPEFDRLWGMHNAGQDGGTADVDIDGPEMWDVSTGGEDIVIGVIDTGVDYNHEDLAANMWVNPGEIADNGIDDDGNGVIDDVHGYNAINGSGDPFDDHYHGTHCAGTIAGVGDNGKGVTGVAWNAKIVGIKFLSAGGSGWTSDAVKSVDYAVKLKQAGVNIRVLSNSWGGGGYSQALADAISEANNEGILFVAAAGNSARDNDSSPHYPSNYDLPNVVSVAALHRRGGLASFSNYGDETVHVAAPGQDIYSCYPDDKYASLSGTSMATPHVSGIGGLVFQAHPELSPEQARSLLMTTSKPLSALDGKVASPGVVSAYRAVTGDTDFPPSISPIDDLGIFHEIDSTTVTVEASDSQDRELSYSAVSDNDSAVSLSFNSNELTIDPADEFLGSFAVTVMVSNGSKQSSVDFDVTVHNNQPPYIYPIADKSVKNSGYLYVRPSIYDPNGDSFSVSASINPSYAGYSYASETLFYFSPNEGYTGTVTVTLQAADQYSVTKEVFLIDVHENHAPVLPSIPAQEMSQNERYYFVDFVPEDEDGDYLRQSFVVSPSEAAIIRNGYQGFYISATDNYVGSATVTVTVSDGDVEKSTSFALMILDNQAPTLDPIQTQLLSSGTSRYIQLNASDDDSSALTYSTKNLHWRPFGEGVEEPEVITQSNWSWVEVSAPEDCAGVLRVQATVSDGKAETSRIFHVVVRQNAWGGADRDNDGVSDEQEEYDGTDPDDRGSAAPPMQNIVCSEWNGFLGGMWNIKEISNRSYDTLSLRTTLYSMYGEAKGSLEYSLEPSIQKDILVQEMEGWEENSYGKVCTEVLNGRTGAIDGRMVYYKAVENEGFQFAFALPLANGIRGTQFVTYNTFQPSIAGEDADNMVANWIQLSNLQADVQTGTLKFYDPEGALLKTERIQLKGGARRDISAHALGRNLVGLVEWSPNDSFAEFQLRNIRYFYDNPEGEESFSAAFQLEGSIGSGAERVAPVDTARGFAVVEVVNTLSEAVTADVNIHNAFGDEVKTLKKRLHPHGSWHIIVNDFLDDSQGIVRVRGGKRASVATTVMQYGWDDAGKLIYLYGVQAVEPVSRTYSGSYNTFLNQGCELSIANPNAEQVLVNVSLRRYDNTGEYWLYDHVVPGRGLARLSICGEAQENGYGTVDVYASNSEALIAHVIRIGAGNQYRFPTPVRH